jgi:ubiquinone/menaquinone biosynthesis C-methylase UbiE/thiamine kinase-like enzyme
MRYLNRRAEETGDWLNSAREIIPEYSGYFIPFYRADSQFLWPTNKDSIILDAGSMWGGLTIPVAQFHREVYAVDKTVETLEFLKIRAEQMGFENIHTFVAPIKSLPFSDNFFDLVILNGVLEWVGLEEDTILEQHWKGKRNEKQNYSKTPEEMQLDVLKELRRVLKPEGSIYISIENRYGIQYFLTYPDDHNNVRFVTFLPRFLANKISKIMGKGEYRTYIYSPRQLANLLRKSGFKINSMYGVFPHYIKIKKAFPLSMARLFKNEVQIGGIIPRVLHKIVKPLIPKSISQHVSPSLFAICRKSNNKDELLPRIQSLLIKANIIKRKDRIRFVISNNRYENYNSTNINIYDHNNCPLYFCKIARDPKISGLRTEAENLKCISNKMSASKGLNFRIPELIYFGVVDDIEVFVTTFLDAKNVKLSPHYIMNKGFDKIGITNGFFRKNIGFAEERLFLKRIDGKIRQAINALVEFQQITSNGKSNINDMLNNIIDKYFEYQRDVPDEIKRDILGLRDRIKIMPESDILTCSIHGDYDFDNVLFFTDDRVGLVDFEHLEREGAPFFDLATLIFNPLIMKWKSSYIRNESLAKYLNQYGAIKYITKWLECFCDKHHIPHSIIPIIPLIAAVEQNAKIYPSFRDPNTYPIYGENMLKELLSINIDGKY